METKKVVCFAAAAAVTMYAGWKLLKMLLHDEQKPNFGDSMNEKIAEKNENLSSSDREDVGKWFKGQLAIEMLDSEDEPEYISYDFDSDMKIGWFTGQLTNDYIDDEDFPDIFMFIDECCDDNYFADWYCPPYKWDDVWYLVVGETYDCEYEYWWDDQY
jgi:hypothetical protein